MSINGMDSKEMEAELAKAQEGEGIAGNLPAVVEHVLIDLCRNRALRHQAGPKDTVAFRADREPDIAACELTSHCSGGNIATLPGIFQ